MDTDSHAGATNRYNRPVFEHFLPIPDDGLDAWLNSLPSRPAVFAMFGRDPQSEPYIAKSANLRRRAHRLLEPANAASKRLNLAGRAAQLAYSEVGSEFATALLLWQATRQYYGEHARKRLHMRPPSLLRLATENDYPRVYVTNRVTQRGLASTYGPFPSRVAAERFLDDSLNFFELRRCTDDLHPDPAFPGCVYSEMKMCLAPCFKGCTDERYAQEAHDVRQYLATRGAWNIARLEQERNAASAALDFEKAAQLHQRMQKMKAVAQQAAPLVHPLAELDAIVIQPAAQETVKPETPIEAARVQTEKMSNRPLLTEASHVAVFLVRAGVISGPGLFSVDGMRHPNEHSGSTSLFAHPAMLEPVPLEPARPDAMSSEPALVSASQQAGPQPHALERPARPPVKRGLLEERLQTVLDELEEQARARKPNAEQLIEHLALLARWYYRPPVRRTGEIFFRGEDRSWPFPRVLRGISRIFCGQKEAVETASPGVESASSKDRASL